MQLLDRFAFFFNPAAHSTVEKGGKIAFWAGLTGGSALWASLFWQLPLPRPAPPIIHHASALEASERLASLWGMSTQALAASPSGAVATTGMRLLGVFADKNGIGMAIVLRDGEPAPLILVAGKEHASGLKLVQVSPQAVRIDDHGREFALQLPQPGSESVLKLADGKPALPPPGNAPLSSTYLPPDTSAKD